MTYLRLKLLVTGGGRVSKGAIEVLLGMKIRQVTPAELLKEDFNTAVFAQLNSRDYHFNTSHKEFRRDEFFKHPELFESSFIDYAKEANILIAGAFWDPRSPVLFNRLQMVEPDFKIRVIADITCDIEGSIPSTKKT